MPNPIFCYELWEENKNNKNERIIGNEAWYMTHFLSSHATAWLLLESTKAYLAIITLKFSGKPDLL